MLPSLHQRMVLDRAGKVLETILLGPPSVTGCPDQSQKSDSEYVNTGL